jgi:hypothetical protein
MPAMASTIASVSVIDELLSPFSANRTVGEMFGEKKLVESPPMWASRHDNGRCDGENEWTSAI